MYMTSSLGSAWNSLRPARPRATKAMVSGACHRMLTGLTLLLMPSETSARLTALSSAMGSLVSTDHVVDCKRKVRLECKIANPPNCTNEHSERGCETRQRRLSQDPGVCAPAGPGAGTVAGEF